MALKTRTTAQWAAILTATGCKPQEVTHWSPLFAEVVRDDRFSKGEEELDLFLGNVLHECDYFRRLEEGLNYSAARIREIGNRSKPGTRWRSLVPIADQIANKPKEFANACYGGRLGNVKPNDGWDYRGSGPIQLTGLANFAAMEKATGLPLVKNPGLLRMPTKEALIVCIHWWEGNVPDAVMSNPVKVRAEVNGGDLGLKDTIRIAALADRAMMA